METNKSNRLKNTISYFMFIVFISSLTSCNNQSTVIQPAQGCNTTNTGFSSVYAQVLARPGSNEYVMMDLPTHQYTFSINANKTICKIGYQAEASFAAAGKSYEIKIVNAAGATIYTGTHRFQSNAMDYQTITPVQLMAGQNYTIKRTPLNYSTVREMTGTLIEYQQPFSFPVSANGFTIVKAEFGDPSFWYAGFGIPKIDIVFQ